MKHNYFYFRSFQVAVLMLIVFVIGGCSLYPTIERHNPVSDPSTIYSNLIASDLFPEGDKSHGSGTVQGEGMNQTSQEHAHLEGDSGHEYFSEAEKMEFLEHVLGGNEQSAGSEQTSSEQGEGAQHSMKIAITFDDGPDLKFTPQILDILNEKNVPATFFVVGIQVNKYPEVLQRMEAEGHLIANHSYNHPSFTKLTPEQLAYEINATDEKIFGVLGHVPTIVRPPYGAINDDVRARLEDMGKEVMLWNIDPRDWDGTSVEDMLDNILSNARDGGNVLLHSFGSKHVANTVTLLPLLIDELSSQGYEFVTADKL